MDEYYNMLDMFGIQFYSYIQLTIKPIHLCNLSRFMVSPKECDAVRPLGFQGEQPCECLQTVVTTIYKISHKDVICIRNRSTITEEFFQVIEL